MNFPVIPRNSRLIIVDDNPAIHDDFRKILSPDRASTENYDAAEAAFFGTEMVKTSKESARYQADSAFQGEEGLKKVKEAVAHHTPYAMAFVDVRMPPGWDGIETTAKLWEADPDLQVVICTAYSDCSWDRMLKQLDESDRLVILKKPFDEIEVLQLVNSLTRKWQLIQESKIKVTGLEEIIASRTAQLVLEQEKLKAIFDNSPEGIFQTTADGHFLTANPALAGIYGYDSPESLMRELTDIGAQLYVNPAQRSEFQHRMARDNFVRDFESEVRCRDGSRKWISESARSITRQGGSLLFYQGFVVDITAQKKAQQERDLMEAHLRQAQKLESVGQLAAGIAHEINTPIQFVGDNLRFIQNSFPDLDHLLGDYHQLEVAAQSNSVTPELLDKIKSSSQKADLSFLKEEIPLALKQSLEGVSRVSHIVSSMKEFAHPGSKEMIALDLNHAIDATITVACSEWKYVADLVTDFAPELPKVFCLPHEFNQVILNLIINAAHAIKEAADNGRRQKGTIKISTRQDGNFAEIRISDTGTGIPENIRHRVFDPFFTTKGVGKGTGQGLAIARSTIVDKHNGEINFESIVGEGTAFTIRLPIISSSAVFEGKWPAAKEMGLS